MRHKIAARQSWCPYSTVIAASNSYVYTHNKFPPFKLHPCAFVNSETLTSINSNLYFIVYIVGTFLAVVRYLLTMSFYFVKRSAR